MTASSSPPAPPSASKQRWQGRRMVAEAAIWLLICVLALRLLPFRHVARLLIGKAAEAESPLPSPSVPLASPEPWQVARAVTRASERVPFEALCLPQAMAAKIMLGMRGHSTILHLSVQMGKETGIAAHAWLTSENVCVIGGGVPAGQTEIARFI